MSELVEVVPFETWAVLGRRVDGSDIMFASKSKEDVFHIRNLMEHEATGPRGPSEVYLRFDMAKLIEAPESFAFVGKTLNLHTT